MARIDDIYDLIGSLPDPLVDRAMAAALPTADGAAARRLVDRLLLRNRVEGGLGLVLYFHQLDEATQARILASSDQLYRPLREAARLRQSQGPANAVDIVRRAGQVRLAYLVCEQLHHGTEALREQAADCLMAMARQAQLDPAWEPAGGDPRTLSPELATYLMSALEDAIGRYRTHVQPAVIRAWLCLLPRPMPGAMARLHELRNPAREALRVILAEAKLPEARRALVPMLGVPDFRESALAGLARAAADDHWADMLAWWPLLLVPACRDAMRKAVEMHELWPQLPATTPAHAARGLATWLDALPLEPHQRTTRLMQLRHCDDAMTRLSALRRLLQMLDRRELARGGLLELVAAFTDDPEPAIARIALRRLLSERWEGLSRLMPQLVNSEHDTISAVARQYLAPLGFARLWESWPKLDPQLRLNAGRAVIKIDPDFHRVIGEKLVSGDRAARLRALTIIHGLNQGDFFEKALIVLACDADEKVASAAVKALGTATSDTARAAIDQALRHGDSRVRANAVEALAQRKSSEQVRTLMQMAEQDVNRPRANAIQALLDMRTEEALAALRRMLDDERPEHRTSALWLVESMGLIEVARQVAELSISDGHAAVKTRARRVIEGLIQGMSEPGPTSPASEDALSMNHLPATPAGGV